MTWLTELIQQHDELESPTSFWYWSALCAISAIVKDNVFTEEGNAGWKLYPSIYVILYADSGVGKGGPINLAHKLVMSVNNTTIISGRSSIQGILGRLSRAGSKREEIVNRTSAGFIVASELSSAFVHDPAGFDILTDLFDRQWRVGNWDSLLKSEQFHLTNPTVTLLAGINEPHFNAMLESKDVFGGFLGRAFLITESQSHGLNPLMLPLRNPPRIDRLVPHLKKLSTLRGPFQTLGSWTESDRYYISKLIDYNGSKETGWFTEAGAAYQDWYMDFYENIAPSLEDKTGTITRTKDSIKKVAMLLSLADEPDLIIKLAHMEEAIESCEKLIGNVRNTTRTAGSTSQHALAKGIIINTILKRIPHRITRKMLMKTLNMHLNTVKDLDDIMEVYQEIGTIQISHEGNQIFYTMPDKQVEEYVKFLKKKGVI